MEFILPLLYSIALSYLILKWKFFKRFHLSLKLVAGIFLFKVIIGVAYGLLHYYVYGGGDTFGYFYESKIIFNRLPDEPGKFLQLTFGYAWYYPKPYIAEYAYKMQYYEEMSSYFMVRMHALMRLVSFNCYYVHVVLYNFLTLIGQLYLFRFFNNKFPKKKNIWLALLFVYPAVSFWASGVHKDGISLAAIGLIFFFSEKISFENRNWKNILALLIGLWLLFVVRTYLLVMLLPALAGYLICQKMKKRKVLTFAIVYSLVIILLFNLYHLGNDWNVMHYIASQQNEFRDITQARTLVQVIPLDDHIASLINSIPLALNHCLLHPHIFELTSPIQIVSALDLIVLWILAALLIFFWKKFHEINWPLMLLCLFFSLGVFVIAGATVPSLGSLVRYKMPAMFFTVAALMIAMDDEKIFSLLKKKQ